MDSSPILVAALRADKAGTKTLKDRACSPQNLNSLSVPHSQRRPGVFSLGQGEGCSSTTSGVSIDRRLPRAETSIRWAHPGGCSLDVRAPGLDRLRPIPPPFLETMQPTKAHRNHRRAPRSPIPDIPKTEEYLRWTQKQKCTLSPRQAYLSLFTSAHHTRYDS